jgi:hypothetical protein
LHAYRQAAEDGSNALRLRPTPAEYLLTGTAYVDMARMLAQSGRKSDPDYIKSLSTAEQLLLNAKIAGAAPEFLVDYNLAVVRLLQGELVQSLTDFQ